MIGVPIETPNTPKFVMLNVVPVNSSALIVPFRVLDAISCTERQSPKNSFLHNLPCLEPLDHYL